MLKVLSLPDAFVAANAVGCYCCIWHCRLHHPYRQTTACSIVLDWMTSYLAGWRQRICYHGEPHRCTAILHRVPYSCCCMQQMSLS